MSGPKIVGPRDGETDPQAMAALAADYGTELEFDSLPDLIATHGLTFPAGSPSA